MKKLGNVKHLACATIAAATVLSVGCLAMADEIATDDLSADQIESGEIEADSGDEAFIAEEAENAIAEEQQGIPDTEIVDEAVAEEDEEIIEEADADAESEEDYVAYEVEETIVSEEASYGVPSGWENKNGKWYYYVDGNPLKGWQKIGTEWYFFFEGDGEMMVGQLYDGVYFNASFIFNYKGQMCTGWKQYNGQWFYCEDNGKCAAGWKNLDGKWYYFSKESKNDPYMVTGPQSIDGTFYMFGLDGSLQSGWVYNFGSWYYANSDGTCAIGWKEIGGKWYYFYESDYGATPWMFRDGVYKIKDNWYGFDDNGAMVTGWYNSSIVEKNGETYYLGNWYYFNKNNGQAKKGWAQIDNKWYYFRKTSDNDEPYAYRGIYVIDGKPYYFDMDTGAMASGGWIQQNYPSYLPFGDSDIWYYADKNGVLATGWKKIGNETYYFGDDPEYPYMRRGLIEVDGKDYFLGSNGKLRIGWFRETDEYGNVLPEYHYADKNGAIVYKKWLELDGKDYYIDENGNMVTGMYYIMGLWYEFDNNGVCLNPSVG